MATFLVIAVIAVAAYFCWPILLLAGICVIGYKIYEECYFNGKNFKAIKEQISSYIDDCNELNEHIEDLKNVDLVADQKQYGHSDFHDNSNWNYKRSELSKVSHAPNIYKCSRTVCDNSRKDPMKYVCKYFGFNADEETLALFEQTLNDFTAVEDGKEALMDQRKEILDGISSKIPPLIKKFSNDKVEEKLGFEEVDLSLSYYPVFKFQYISSGGNASTENTIRMDLDNLEDMVNYLNDRIKWKKTAAYQRSLMTRQLRTSILKRDGYACKQCGVSVEDEPHLLLEVDHIVPISKGGVTTEDNLQTLCWRCNRSKGAKVEAD